MSDKTAIYLTDEDVKLFVKFRQFQDDFQKMIKGGCFQFSNGCAIIHRDSNGILKNIEIKTFTFTRKAAIDKHLR